MLRYLRRLQAKDIALDRAMIPLGSCTMKLNATAEMIPVTWPEFANLHPFAPQDQAAGYQALFRDLEAWLKEITGFDAVSLQPNAGSQGEYAGLLAIRAWHDSRGDQAPRRLPDPLLRPRHQPRQRRHGRHARWSWSAATPHGNVDLADLEAKAEQHQDRLAALMVTYPSTHGVFEARDQGHLRHRPRPWRPGLLDGANLNALVGIARPAELGADVCHMNLHKTFCIPHGGGGPGMGPIGVKAHLAPFLPDHPVVTGVNPYDGEHSVGAVSAAPWGSAAILPISWAYIAMMGGPGLTRATEVAILNANYVATRLAPHYPVVYTGQNGMVAHECIVDIRGIKETHRHHRRGRRQAPGRLRLPRAHHVLARARDHDDRAHRERVPGRARPLLRGDDRHPRGDPRDRAGHAPTALDNLLKHAPHTADLLLGDWTRPYAKEQAFFPAPAVQDDKYWPPVAPGRQCLRRPAPGVQLPADGGVPAGGGVARRGRKAPSRAPPASVEWYPPERAMLCLSRCHGGGAESLIGRDRSGVPGPAGRVGARGPAPDEDPPRRDRG